MICSACPDCRFAVTDVEMELESFGIDYTFEIHITVETNDVKGFERVCTHNDIKPIIIEYQRWTDRKTATQLMTAQTVRDTMEAVINEIKRIKTVFKVSGMKVIREKVEVGPTDAGLHDVLYMESHLAFTLPTNQINDLRNHAERVGVHMSRNAFKSDPALKRSTYMVTIREYDIDPIPFIRHTKGIRDGFARRGFGAAKTIIEACIFDTNQCNDDEWIDPTGTLKQKGI